MSAKIGIFVPQGWRMDLVDIKDPVEKYEAMTNVAKEADKLGYESIWLYDHFHTVPTPETEAVFECWTTTAALARDTQNVKIGQMVGCMGYRNPAVLAKMASTIDVLSHGRLFFGIGAGWYEHEYRAYGFGFPDTRERMRRLAEGVRVIRTMWDDERAKFEGEYYTVDGAINEPKSAGRKIPLLIGGGGEQVTLKLVAKFGDACNISGIDPEVYRQKFAILKEHCDEVNRPYDEITRTANVTVGYADSDAEADQLTKKIRGQSSLEQYRKGNLVGNSQQIVEGLQKLVEAGAQYFTIYLLDAYKLDNVRRLAAEVLPAFK